MSTGCSKCPERANGNTIPGVGMSSTGPISFLFVLLFLKATAGVCPAQQHTSGGGSRTTQGAGPTSHSSPTAPLPTQGPATSPGTTRDSAQAAEHQTQQTLLQNTKIDKTPVLGMFKPISPSLQLQPEPSRLLSPILRVLFAPQSSLLRDKVLLLLCHGSSSHCPSQSKT